MLTSVEGTYRNGWIELTETPEDIPNQTRVIVTFLPPQEVDLKSYGIDQGQAADLRARLSSFAGEWDAPGMDIYDHYDAAKPAR